jgi:hypothetical protein
LACFQENKHLATRKHDALGFDQLIEIGCTFHSILLPRAFHFMIMAHFPRTPQQISLPAGASEAETMATPQQASSSYRSWISNMRSHVLSCEEGHRWLETSVRAKVFEGDREGYFGDWVF